MPTKSNLVADTELFFKRHWEIEDNFPHWDFSWSWRGPVPNHLLGGLYALFSGEKLLYIGLGASRGGGIYQDRGISKRLMAHVLQSAPMTSNVSYIPRDRWHQLGVDLIATIGFPKDCDYLAPALEDFLIGQLNPPQNSIKRKFPQTVS